MREKTKKILAKFLPVTGAVRRRMFCLLGGMGIGALLLANLIWFPGIIEEIRQAQGELRRVSVRLIRDHIHVHIEENEEDLKATALRFRSYLVENDREGLRLTAQRLFQRNSAFEEIGILDGNGKEILRLSRRTVITDRDLLDRSASSLFREGMKQEIHWEPVTITETSEPRVTLTVRLPGFDTPLSGLVYGVINLKSLWNLTREFKLNYEGRAYIVEEKGRLIAAADPSVVLRQISFADRHLIQQLTDPGNSLDHSFVEGNYKNEKGVPVTATGLLLTRPWWGVVIEQPQSVLFAPIRQKIWVFVGLCLMGLLLSFGLAHTLSRRFTEPIVRLQEGAEQIGAGNLEYRVPIETRDEIGELASQFNHMAEQLHASHQATLSALTIPVISQLNEMQEVLDDVTAKVITVTEAEVASIRIMDDEKRDFVSSVYRGFSEAYMHERPTLVKEEAGGERILQSPEQFILEDILADSGGNANPLAREGFRSVVYLPLMTPQRTFGLMTLASREPGRLNSKGADLFRAMAHQISVALENAQLFAARKRAEEALQKSEDRLKAIFNSVRAGILIIDPETHVIVDVNPVATEMIAVSKDRIVGSICHKHVCPAEEGRCPVTDLGQRVDNAEKVLLRAGGKEIAIIKTVSIVSLGGRDHLVESFLDITEHKKNEEKVAALREQLRQSQKMESIGQLAGGVAHDFNNLLTVIRGYSEISLGELQKGDPLWENIEEVRKAADRAADLTRQLPAFSRRQILEFKTVNLNNLIQAVEKMLRRIIGEDIELIIHARENLGSTKTDPGQMEQVIMNLAVNARDAMPSGGKLILETDNVYLDEEHACNHMSMKPGYYVKLSISDTGCGMTPEIRERVFEPFFTTKEKGKGTGLGLSTVYGIVKQSDGNIWVYSEPGKGTTFNIYLPRMDEPVEVLMGKREFKEIPQGNETVLVVEDEEAVRKLAVQTLKKQGYRLLEAARGDEALLIVKRHPEPIHLILTDVVMPGISGPKLVESLRKVRKEFKVLYMSGYTDESVIYHGVREGEVNFIQKPFTMENIGRKVREVLGV